MASASMAGITFIDTILLSVSHLEGGKPSLGLLFHELVHVIQYRLLGVETFIDLYVRGWAENGMDYYAIPLERDAYELQNRYETDPTRPFSVASEVARRLKV